MNVKDPHRYDDIIDLPHHVSKTHKQMSNLDRAAQFAPFAALSGHEEAIVEVERRLDEKIILSESQIEDINHKLQMIDKKIIEQPLYLTYFQPDKKKNGGYYHTIYTFVHKIDFYEHVLILPDKSKIKFDDILEMNLD